MCFSRFLERRKNKLSDLINFCESRDNILIFYPYIYQSSNGGQHTIRFLPPPKLNLSIHSGAYAHLAYRPFFGGISATWDATI